MTYLKIISYLKKNYIITLSVAVAAVCLGVYFFRGDQVTRLAADQDDLRVRHTRILKNLKNASEIEGDLEELKSHMAEIDGRLFDPEDLATNQRYFYQLETQTGVKLQSIQQIIKVLPTGKGSQKERKKAERSKFQELVYDMEVRGSYSEILDFLRKIEGGSAFAVLDGLTVVRGAEGVADEGAGKLNMRISFNVLAKKA